MLTGADIRRFRRALGVNQTEFARRMGLAQSTLSLIEVGRIAVGDEHVQQLLAKFHSPTDKPTFAEFLTEIEKGRAESQAALHAPGTRYLTLTAWRWDNTFDLSRVPPRDTAADLVTVRATDHPVIALQMPRQSEHWADGETLVFEQCRAEDLSDGAICLVQSRGMRGRGLRTSICVVRAAQAKRGRAVQFEPVVPAGPFIAAASDNLVALLRLIHRSVCVAAHARV